MTNDCNAIICTEKWKEPIVVKMKKKKKVGRCTLLDIKAYYKVLVIKADWCWQGINRSAEQHRECRNRPTHVCTHKVYDRGEATNQWERIGYSIND